MDSILQFSPLHCFHTHFHRMGLHSHILSILFTIILITTTTTILAADCTGTLVKLNTTKYPEARCLDGSPGAFYMQLVEGSKGWMIALEGGGECVTQRQCTSRAKTDLGTSNEYKDSMTMFQLQVCFFSFPIFPLFFSQFFIQDILSIFFCSPLTLFESNIPHPISISIRAVIRQTNLKIGTRSISSIVLVIFSLGKIFLEPNVHMGFNSLVIILSATQLII